MQSKPIRNIDYDAGSAKHVTFFNEFFKRGRCDLLIKIQRSTRGGPAASSQDNSRELQSLRDQISNLEQHISELNNQMQERVRRLELDLLQRIEQVVMTLQQQQQQQHQSAQTQLHHTAMSMAIPSATGITPMRESSISSVASTQQRQMMNQMPPLSQQHHPLQHHQQQPLHQNYQNGWDMNSFAAEFSRAQSIASNANASMESQMHQAHMPAPSLPPHPKQKSLPPVNLPGAVHVPPGRFNSLRGISTLSRGITEAMARGTSVESTTSGVVLRNSWEDRIFSMLMLDNNDSTAVTALVNGENAGASLDSQMLHPNSMAPGAVQNPTSSSSPTPPGMNGAEMAPAQSFHDFLSKNMLPAPAIVSNGTLERDISISNPPIHDTSERYGDMSSVSSSDIP
jgi:hypothetical protein